MGLDIRPGGAHWAYSGFLNFRRRLAEAEGLQLEDMEGFTTLPHRGNGGPGKPWYNADGEPVTPLAPLIYHSDCDGYLTSYECETVLPRLKEIVESWEDGDYDKEHAGYLIAGMLHSAKHGCAVVFS